MLLNNRAGIVGGNPGTHYAFTNAVTTDWFQRNNRSNWNKTGRLRNYHCGDANVTGLTTKASQPAGNTHPVAYTLAQKPGRIASRKICFLTLEGGADVKIGSLIFTSSCVVGVDGAATGTLIVGSLIDGTTAIVIDGSAVGRLTVGGVGTASITIEANGAILGHVAAAGTSPIVIGAVADLVGKGWLVGNAPIELDGTLESYAVGWLQGSTEETGELTAANIAAAVWEALSASHNTENTMGAALNSAGAAADPLLGVVEGALTLRDVQKIILAMMAGKSSGGGTGTISIRDQADIRDRIVLHVDKKGNRSSVDLDTT